MENYKILSIIGKSYLSVVYKGVKIDTDQIVAIKKLQKKHATALKMFTKEQVLFSKINNSSNSLRLYDVIDSQDYLYIVTDLVESNLEAELTKRTEPFEINEIRRIIYHLIHSLKSIHETGFVHRQIMPKHCVLHENTFKLVNFKLSTPKNISDYERPENAHYTAPELLLKSGPISQAADIFSLGVVLVEMLLKQSIFAGSSDIEVLAAMVYIMGMPTDWKEGKKNLKEMILIKGNYTNNLKLMLRNQQAKVVSLAIQMLQWNPIKRPSAAILLGHSFFDELSKEEINILKKVRKMAVPVKKTIKELGKNELRLMKPTEFKNNKVLTSGSFGKKSATVKVLPVIFPGRIDPIKRKLSKVKSEAKNSMAGKLEEIQKRLRKTIDWASTATSMDEKTKLPKPVDKLVTDKFAENQRKTRKLPTLKVRTDTIM